LEGLAKDDVGIIYIHLVILWLIGIFYG
jgi:hypothetical protein